MAPDSISSWTKDWANTKFLNIRYFREIKSTNSFAKDNLPEDEFELIVCDHQTAGRGRGDHVWTDTKPGSTLLSSWVFQTIKSPQPISAPLIGLALYHAAIKTWPPAPFSMKAPNDLYCGDKKVGGLLVETVSEGVSHYLIVGLGLNITHHPHIANSGAFADFTGPISRDQWNRFLDFFKGGLDMLLFELSNSALSERKRLLLLEALNRFPLLKEKYLEVLPDGGLRNSSGVIPWTQL